jgi:hypothetical protein
MRCLTNLRWTTTIALFAAMMTPLFAPLRAINLTAPDPSLPPCCRRDGKHHCTMMASVLAAEQNSQAGPQFRRIPEPCPYRLAPPACRSIRSIAATSSFEIHAGIKSDQAVPPQVANLAQLSESRVHFKRGPPILF